MLCGRSHYHLYREWRVLSMKRQIEVCCFAVNHLFGRLYEFFINQKSEGFIMGKKLTGLTAIAASMLLMPVANAADNITDVFKEGKTGVSFRLRYEDVDIDRAARDTADAVTLRTRLNFGTADFYGVTTFIEFDDVKAMDYSSYSSGLNANTKNALIADPEYTEVNQSWIAYSNFDTVFKYGNQRITLDNQRFVGNVGWRQNEQTYDAFSITNKSLADTTFFLANVYNVNNIMGGKADHNTLLFNANYSGLEYLNITGYVYNVEQVDFDTRDTIGLRLVGVVGVGDDVSLGYTAEFASQSYELESDSTKDYDADYLLLEASVMFSGVTINLGNELQGSDDGIGAFTTPLGTNHAHNGWADQVLAAPVAKAANGLNDTYLSVSGTVPGNVNLMVVAHAFTADEKVAGDDDLGNEIDFVASTKFAKTYGVALHYAAYSQGDKAISNPDTNKVWLTLSADF